MSSTPTAEAAATVQTLMDRVLKVVTEVAGCDPGEAKPNSHLGADLKIGQNTIGNPDWLDLRYRLEREFNIRIPETNLPTPENLKGATPEDILLFIRPLLPAEAI